MKAISLAPDDELAIEESAVLSAPLELAA